MDPDNIKLTSMNKLFEYERLSRNIDNIDDIGSLRNLAKSYIKLYFFQQEILSNLGEL
jgi:hypothetical protein